MARLPEKIIDRRQLDSLLRVATAGSLICATGALFLLIADLGEPIDWRRLAFEMAGLVAPLSLLISMQRR